MLISKVSESEQNNLKRLYDEFFKKYPERDDENNLPKNSIIKEINISPFDHWLSRDEAEKEIKGFAKNPSKEMKNKFRQNEEKNLRFIAQYLKTKEFFYIETICVELHEDDNNLYETIFYKCDPKSDFYQPENNAIPESQFFLPNLNIYMQIKDDYLIKFEILKTDESEIETIIKLAKNCGLYINQ